MEDVEDILGFLSFSEFSEIECAGPASSFPATTDCSLSTSPRSQCWDQDCLFGPACSPREREASAESAAEPTCGNADNSNLKQRRGTAMQNLLEITIPLERVETQLTTCGHYVAYKSLDEALEHAASGSLSFNSFQLNSLADGRPLSALAFHLFDRRGLISDLGLDSHKLKNFLICVEDHMADHPYHNRLHITDVLQMLHGDTLPGGGLHGLCQDNPIHLLAVLLAAIVHDVDHPGVNNDFLIKSGHPLALMYGGETGDGVACGVAEQHHVATALEIIRREDCNFLSHFTDDQWCIVWGIVREMVLNTDMKRHMPFLSEVKAWISSGDAHSEDWHEMSIVKIAMLTSIAMKCADLGHTVRPSAIHVRWAKAVTTEFYQQGDKEEKAGLPVTQGMFRPEDESEVFESQALFLEHHVMPLFKEWACFSESTRATEIVNRLSENISHWTELARQRRGENAPPSPATSVLLQKLRSRPRGATGKDGSSKLGRYRTSSLAIPGRLTVPSIEAMKAHVSPLSGDTEGSCRRLSSSHSPRFTSSMLNIPRDEFLDRIGKAVTFATSPTSDGDGLSKRLHGQRTRGANCSSLRATVPFGHETTPSPLRGMVLGDVHSIWADSAD